jgi:hypothetical protein
MKRSAPAGFNRRFFLRGVGGLCVGLPLLESLLPKAARAQAAAAPARRFVAFLECNGVNMSKFFPVTPYGALTSGSFTGTALAPLAGLESKLLIPRGIHKVPKGFNFGGQTPVGCDHQNGMGGKLTAQQLAGADHYANGISVDQEIAKKINPMARPSMTLKVGPRGQGVLSVISYTGPQQPVQGENNPWFAFRDFMGMGAGVDPAIAQRMTQRRQSVLDLVKGDMDLLKTKRISTADKEKLDLHYTSIRDIEVAMTAGGMQACSLPSARASEIQGLNPNTVGNDSEYKKIGQMQMDILALALACDHTRVATLQWGDGSGGPIFNFDGLSNQYNHHKLSHGNTRDDNTGGMVADYLDRLAAIDVWYATQFRYLCDKLAAYGEANGQSVLDNSAVVWMNELSDGLEHNFMDMPYVIAGSSGGYFKQGQYIKVTKQAGTKNDVDAPHNKLLTMFINGVGIRNTDGSLIENFGGGFGAPGEFTELKA